MASQIVKLPNIKQGHVGETAWVAYAYACMLSSIIKKGRQTRSISEVFLRPLVNCPSPRPSYITVSYPQKTSTYQPGVFCVILTTYIHITKDFPPAGGFLC